MKSQVQKPVMLVLFLLASCIFNHTSAQTSTKPLSGRVPLSKLSAKAKAYITDNYKGYKAVGAAYDPLCSGGDAIDVSVSKPNSPTYSLIFLLDGTFIQQEIDVPFAEAPPKVLETLKSKYASYKYSKQIEKLQLVDKKIQYMVDISKGKTEKEVIFDDQGAVVCEN